MTPSLFHELEIGPLRLKNNLIAAPMAGLSSLPYRLMAIEEGCALAISEMVSAEGLIRAQARTRHYIENAPGARPFGVQLFGADPVAMAEATRILEDEPIDLIDINMGCPVKKVCSKGAGAAMMKTPIRAGEIIRAVRKNTTRPLTIKLRAGWDDENRNALEMALIAQNSGADAVTVHGRTREQEFRGKADWSVIAEVKAALTIPVIGNGDVRSREDAVRMFEETRCDGCMIGRAAVGNPWIFGAILHGRPRPDPATQCTAVLRHFDALCALLGEKKAVLGMRTILHWYTRGQPGVRHLMQEVHRIRTAKELRPTIERFFAALVSAREGTE